jgi:hypothetical protein
MRILFVLWVLCIVGTGWLAITDAAFCAFDDWPRQSELDLFYSSTEPENPLWMPSIANGYIGTLVGNDTVYVSGVYNGQSDIGSFFTSILVNGSPHIVSQIRLIARASLPRSPFLSQGFLLVDLCWTYDKRCFHVARWWVQHR